MNGKGLFVEYQFSGFRFRRNRPFKLDDDIFLRPDAVLHKGTGALTDMPDNVMPIWRNIPRELAQRKAERMGYESLDKDEQTAIQMPASMIRLLKQREGEGWVGDIGANFDTRSHQFLEGEKQPFNYLVGKPQSEVDL